MVFSLVIGIREGLGSGSLIWNQWLRDEKKPCQGLVKDLGISSYPRDRERRWGRTGSGRTGLQVLFSGPMAVE